MSTGIIITLIICGTILLLSIVSIIGRVITSKKTLKGMSKFAARLDDIFKEEN